MLHAVGVKFGVNDLEIDDRVDLHGNVVLGDNGLRREIHHLFLQADPLGHPVDEGQFDVQTHAPGGLIRTQALHHEGAGLLHHLDICDQQNQDNDADSG